jgi:hypothetical protein
LFRARNPYGDRSGMIEDRHIAGYMADNADTWRWCAPLR